ncbi:FAD-binding oxidoreductase [Chitinophagaceae bacterium LB-8]|jgi:ferredoxin-NADP reductase|uniref:FAD-binding oxidoreductase n=1 Tax=Paraflavisolibacter caeni TaxID=2982496 RepID=A0A9X2XW42_9BACT|nr:FAD-binding oxidoreductase [Paraflavisolibacter caeni]MCU7550474.1 FAD-binding oxidoreductase [Paraflavisolibacter caeni]
MEQTVKIITIEQVTHNVKRFRFEKPPGFHFNPGQATEVSINKEGWQEERRPFTFTALNEAPYLEFTIKIYSDHPGVTNELNTLTPGDELIIRDVWGTIEYKGPGYFIAGGAGITPFIAILRQLNKENKLEGNKLFFSNKTDRDIILKDELTSMLGPNAIFIITDEQSERYQHGYINEQFLKDNIDDLTKHFYLCGPPKMIENVQDCLVKLGAFPEAVVFEK